MPAMNDPVPAPFETGTRWLLCGTKDRMTAVEQSGFSRDSRSCAAPISQEVHCRPVSAPKLVVIDQAPSEAEVMVIPF
jgi:hypothetical protein